MLNIKKILKDPKAIEQKLRSKEADIDLSSLLEAHQELSALKEKLQQKQADMNRLSKEIGVKKREGKDTSDLFEKVSELKTTIHRRSEELQKLEERFQSLMETLPNIPDDDVKESLDPKDNVCVKTVGKKSDFSFPLKNHLELNELHDLFDFPRGAKISGTGWPVYKGMGAMIEWALLNLMIRTHIKNGFSFHLLPHLVHKETMYGSGQLPKFEHQLYKLQDKDYPLYLIPTAEVALNGLHANEILEESDLPKLYLAYTPCYRREAGAAGASERGLIRVHQFNKIEMFAFATEKNSDETFDKMVASAEEVLEALELHYRNMLLVTGDMSFGAARTLDIEAYLPGQERYYEVSSVSNCRSFQARRSMIRYHSKETGKNEYAHTLNGSGLATSRLMVALLENNQKEDGSILLPKALAPYLGEENLKLTPNTNDKK